MNKQPFWHFLPYINNRTAWKPISFPAILIIPFGVSSSGDPLAQSAPKEIIISILDVVRRNKVVGHQYKDVFFPDAELYKITVNDLELTKRILDIADFENDGINATIINRKGLIGTVPYDPNNLYYDFSDIEISVDNLTNGRYKLSYQARLNRRVYDSLGGLVCIDDSLEDLIIDNIDINHPGEIINEMVKTSPSIWFSNKNLSDEPLITLYKPLTDCLQNVFDEQSLLSRINFINNAYPETIQLLGQTIGWEIPYFPKSLDLLRKSVLRTSTYFQKNRSNFNSIHQLFDLFGYNILLRNLWYKPDNSKLIEPIYGYSPIEYKDQYVLDVAIGNLKAPGFYSTNVQLICKPSTKTKYDNFTDIGSDVYVDAYAVNVGSDAEAELINFISSGNYDDISESIFGLVNNDLNSRLIGKNIYASHQLKIDKNNKVTEIYQTGPRSIIFNSELSYDKYKPSVSIQLDGHWNDNNIAIYIFILYKTQKIVINDPTYEEKRSNYFDIRVNSRDDTLNPTSLVLDYALEFLYRIKALHSLLRYIFIESNNSEVYLVTDYCYGPGLSISSDSDIGQQQVPPAILPINSNDNQCQEQDPRNLGYKDSDIAYRDRITAGLIEEWNSYLSYDNRKPEGGILSMLPQMPDLARIIGLYNSYNQDAFINSYDQMTFFGILEPFDLSNQLIYTKSTNIYNYNSTLINIDDRCTEFRKFGQITYDDTYQPVNNLETREPICFKGRINQDLFINLSINPDEQVLLAGCTNNMGNGAAFTTPKISTIIRGGSNNRLIGSLSPKPLISSNQPTSGINFENYYKPKFDKVDINPIQIIGDSNSVLHYWNRPTTVDSTWDSSANTIPNFGIQRTNMHFPGTRFISMAKYNGTFISDTYTHRPWDFDVCNDQLNTKLITSIDGNEYLIFDNMPYSFTNNTGEPDLPMMGSPTISNIAPNQVVHSIYSRFADGLTLGLCPFDTSVDSLGVMNVNYPLFKSATKCGTGDIVDYADGYPCVTGILNLTPDFDNDYDYDTGSTGPINGLYLFTLMSGILDESQGIRLDCDCSVAPCDLTEQSTQCTIRDIDDINIDRYMSLDENLGICSIMLDGEIPSMFELQN